MTEKSNYQEKSFRFIIFSFLTGLKKGFPRGIL